MPYLTEINSRVKESLAAQKLPVVPITVFAKGGHYALAELGESTKTIFLYLMLLIWILPHGTVKQALLDQYQVIDIIFFNIRFVYSVPTVCNKLLMIKNLKLKFSVA